MVDKSGEDALFELSTQNAIKTGIDALYDLANKGKPVKVADIVRQFKVSRRLAMQWIRVLEERGLIKVRYHLFGDVEVIRR